ncbi:leucine-rich alpha-2-glycoprotein-like [Pseudoliparis swirei]|uniref:leucine-rich alpha-2-glycoprotein-like n=1 Tax=Pseudoliparis swirei TaxID=2059687 RepID=UPI0024BED048|nr:leucine-rich alpha-2-glycoprotein-like [Pseudoliparis swirei]
MKPSRSMKHRRNAAVLSSALKMAVWMLLTLTALAGCAHSCPDLCSCSFTEVVCSQSALTHFPVDGLPSNTTRLSIQSTNLSSVTASHLSAVPLLNDLQLYHTNLKSLPSDLLKNVPHLNTLDLTGNHLVHLPSNVFRHDSLQSLVLRNNLIQTADAEWFSGNSSITWLDLSGNRLTVVPAALLQRLPSLENLDVSDNNLRDLEPAALRNLRRLETLNLASNNLSSLTPTIFSHNLKLSQLFLQDNQLQELPGTLLQGLQHLELLLLNQNQLQRSPSGLLDDRTSSFRVVLGGNPWVCDEKMEYLWKWLAVHPQNVLFSEEVTCARPEALEHRQVVSLTSGELGLHTIQNQ